MIEKLDPNDSQDNRPSHIIAKLNEIIEVVNNWFEELDQDNKDK